ncbi:MULTISPECIES: hypothetical protein [Lactobacillaceae]|jgi:asparagine N-glycosylation enzyme membrane subunit Stt3|uniref:Uncharacterized protein n=10 Tax=Lactobacillales TaxID=186826 RepID=A0A2H5BSU1_9LACO|nr:MULTISPECIES: hypothetical protein [Lactobacillaceae]MCI1632176.1 hypothetical protein [Lacticaseibacillus paracasei]PNW61849.1 hypothetical protein ACZ99_16245 [Lactobacillus sp. ATCC 15578]AUG89720.1 hypothetical protein [Weissella cibaria]AUI80325.1 hypothetical protein BB562_16570 [Lactiplantibacillus pentosus]KRK09066.1 hypothetical protein FD11_GL001384 [Ligilactobacillus pobuzihii E100301 = KCTC 13174]
MTFFIDLLLLLTLFFLISYLYTTKKEKRKKTSIIELGRLPILYGKHYRTFQKFNKFRLLFGALALISLTIGIYTAIFERDFSMLGFTDSIGFFALFFAFFMELLKNQTIQRKKIQYDHALKITDKEKRNKTISIYGICACCFLLGILTFTTL